jgi:V8-like Glu-specific endopeptidase
MSTDKPETVFNPELRHLGKSIDELLPVLWKTDTSTPLSQLLNIVAQARTLGDEGFDLVMGLAEKLRSLRAFDDLYVLTSEMNAVGLKDRTSELYEIQALIELGVFETALDLVRPLLVDDLAQKKKPGEAYGHLGRIYKQMFVNAETGGTHVESEVKRLYVERSFNAYMYAWENLRDERGSYHAVNALAMAHLAARKGYTQKNPKLPELARAIIAVVEKQKDVWAKATLGETLLALEDYDGATKAYAEFADHPDVTPFTIGAALRQVTEIWNLNGGDDKEGKPVRLLKAGMLAKLSAFARFEKLSPRDAAKVTALEVRLLPEEVSRMEADLRAKLPPDMPDQAARDMEILKNATAEELPNLIGINKPISQRIVLRKLERSAGVCRIETRIDGAWKGVGTGFALEGRLLSPKWAGQDIIVTNNHVLSSSGCVHSHKAETSRAVFERLDKDGQVAELSHVLWESEHTAHDISILALKNGLPTGAKALATLSGSSLGGRARDDNGIGTCYLIGYPHGNELCFSLSDNVLLDHEGPKEAKFEVVDGVPVCVNASASPARLHYRTPTTRGSSGSPVFDAIGIELIGVHHAGRPDMNRLNNRGGCYAANEGIWIQSIRKAIEADAGKTALESALISERPHGFPSGGPATASHSHEAPLIGVALGAARLEDGAMPRVAIFKGSPGSPKPGVSAAARELIFKPGRADEDDIIAARLGLETVIGRDNRTRVTETDMSPWRMICSIRVTRGDLTNVGTGFMIGPRTLLTAGHVLVSPDNPHLPTRVQVIPGLNGERTPYRSHSAERFSVHPKWSKEFSPACDVALIHLGQNLGDELGWFRVDAKAPTEMIGHWVHVTGYPAEKKEARGQETSVPLSRQACQLWHHAAPIDRFEVGRVFYRVDTTEGQSGAPIYLLDEDQNYATPTAVGIHAYGTRGTPSSRAPANSGVWFNPAILDFIAKNLDT